MCVVTQVRAQTTGRGLWQVQGLVPLLRRKSRTATIVDWAPQMRESDRLHCTAPHPGTGPKTNLKRIDSLHSCYIRRGPLPAAPPTSLDPTVGSCHLPSLPLSTRAAQCKLPLPFGCATMVEALRGDVSTSSAHMDRRSDKALHSQIFGYARSLAVPRSNRSCPQPAPFVYLHRYHPFTTFGTLSSAHLTTRGLIHAH